MQEQNAPLTKSNRLAFEKSPYLLQHAHNPVDWYPWGKEAFDKARLEDKPVFLSIGYSTCHWCHVMERESFEDPETARVLNEVFVPIKVDREERPDLDNIYMNVCHLMTGSGGWPLTILLTPDRKPFFAATFLAKQSVTGRVGLIDLSRRVQRFWQAEREKIFASSTEVLAALGRSTTRPSGQDMDRSTLDRAFENLTQRYDADQGGFSQQPKFPTPHNILFLLRYAKRTGQPSALTMVEKTLEAMRLGGMFDQVGFGFHRYSTDAQWRVPHFEKMLYDQALLAIAYTEAYQALGRPLFQRTAHEIFTYVLRDMTDPLGGFYSAEDADSEKQEGKFYLWTEQEVRQVLKGEDADLILSFFNFDKDGNFFEEHTGKKTGRNIPFVTRTEKAFAKDGRLSDTELRARLEAAGQRLFAAREQRVHPHKDDKILTDWNGLMIAALARAGRVFDRSAYTQAATRATDFLLENMRTKNGELLHRYREGEAAIPGFLDDYAFFTWGLLELYETTFQTRYLEQALALTRLANERFWDEEHGGYHLTAAGGKDLLVRPKEIYDGALPSGNSVAASNLLRLARITGDADLERRAEALERAFSPIVLRDPSGFTHLMTALDFRIGPSTKIVVAGEPGHPETVAMVRALNAPFLPNKVVLFRPTNEPSPNVCRIAPSTETNRGIDGRATAYVCHDQTCQKPTTDLAEMAHLLNAEPAP